MTYNTNSDEGELIHFYFLVDVELTSYDDAMKTQVRRNTIIEEIKSIKKNHT